MPSVSQVNAVEEVSFCNSVERSRMILLCRSVHFIVCLLAGACLPGKRARVCVCVCVWLRDSVYVE